MKNYIGCKIIRAKPMTRHEFEKYKNNKTIIVENAQGYLVQYPDDYMSWAPKEVFENAYREITENEYSLAMGRDITKNKAKLIEIDRSGNGNGKAICPNCRELVFGMGRIKYCPYCTQKLKWTRGD